jgi:hypothetical protein
MRLKWLPFTALAACSAQSQTTAGPAPAPPTGATIESSGFATILSVPPEPYPESAPAFDRGESEPQRLAREAAISVSEAEARMNPDEATRNAAMALRRRLESGARGNYVDVRIVRDPLPRFVFYFRRDAAATLARFTSDKRFSAREGGRPARELQPLFDEWMAKLGKHRLVSGGSIDAFHGEVELDMGVSRSEFEPIAARESWRVPPEVRLDFAREIDPASLVAPDAAPFIRTFPRSDRAPGATLDIAIHGRIVLRDGCFRLDDGHGGGPLVLFGRETALRRDAQGYLMVVSAHYSGARGRIGEEMIWGRHPGAPEDSPPVQEIRRHCGQDPIASVGSPTSARLFRIRPGAIDSYSQVRRISRERAWQEIKTCWIEQDSARAAGRPVAMRDCDFPGPVNPPPPARR